MPGENQVGYLEKLSGWALAQAAQRVKSHQPGCIQNGGDVALGDTVSGRGGVGCASGSQSTFPT